MASLAVQCALRWWGKPHPTVAIAGISHISNLGHACLAYLRSELKRGKPPICPLPLRGRAGVGLVGKPRCSMRTPVVGQAPPYGG